MSQCTLHLGVHDSAALQSIAEAYQRNPNVPLCIMTADDAQSRTVQSDLRFFLGNELSAHVYPARPSPLSALPFPSDIGHERLSALHALHTHSAQAPIIIASLPAALQFTPPHATIRQHTLRVRERENYDRDELIVQLQHAGYEAQSLVEDRGTFAVRGSLIDCWPPDAAAPWRIEWDGDTICSLRHFHPSTQHSQGAVTALEIGPAHELLFDEKTQAQVSAYIKTLADDADLPVPARQVLLDALRHEQRTPLLHSVLPAFYDPRATLLDHCAADTHLYILDGSTLEQQATQITAELAREQRESTGIASIIPPTDVLSPWAQWLEHVVSQRTTFFIGAPHSVATCCTEQHTTSHSIPRPHASGDAYFEASTAHITEWIAQGYAVTIVCHTSLSAERCFDLLQWHNLHARTEGSAVPRQINITIGQLSAGFILPDNQRVMMTEEELFGKKLRRTRKASPRPADAFTSFHDLHVGDYVVHEQHGVGRYCGLVHMELPSGRGESVMHDFVQLEYLGDDKFYLPIYRLNTLQRFIGGTDHAPVLDKMGGKRWSNVKAKASKAIRSMANELLKIYAERKLRRGHAFSGRDQALETFESYFPYDETPDQASAIDAAIADMQSEQPMDRLICGDVGYGKTEVAMRAAFRAAADGKQVAILCPTTLLAYQHAQTFTERFANTAIRIELLSRFRSTAERKKVLADLAAGTVDIVIGTHRLLSKDVSIPRLGLLVIDEEQRFGVTHKERLRALRATVDTLAMSATPIPRTLHMSMAGLRDVSIIQTPPADRHAIRTYIVPFNDQIVRGAITKELARGGQVFFLHNRVQTIQSMRDRLQRLLPEVRVQVAHGQMGEQELEDAMQHFMERRADVLLCTTIIEAGIDIPSANTLIVNRADTFGLSQLYQIRGRVGRSNVQASAYLLTPSPHDDGEPAPITKSAQRRLAALARHTELGSGFSIAMHDLEMRGAGNLLGAEQSGHIEDIGYEMFTRMLERTIRQLQNADEPIDLDPEITLPIPAFLPEDYIADANLRLVWYKRLASANDRDEIAQAEAELTDRFGAPPAEAQHLLQVIGLRIDALSRGIEQVQFNQGVWRIRFHDKTPIDPAQLIDMATAQPDRYQLRPDGIFQARYPGSPGEGQTPTHIFRTARDLLARITV